MWWLIVIGIASIVAGASGQFVLMGTNSSGALIVVGIVFMLVGCIPFLTRGRDKKEAEERAMRLDRMRWKRQEAAKASRPAAGTEDKEEL